MQYDDGSWVKFNDQTVCPTYKHVAIGTGQGGYSTSYKYCKTVHGDSGNNSDQEDEKAINENNMESESEQKLTCKNGKKENDGLGLQDLLSDIDEPVNED